MPDPFEIRFPDNAAQAEYWNTVAGETWVAHQADLDARLAPFGAILVDRACPDPGQSVIDVGCGSGATLLRLAERVGPTGRVLGIDISAPMLALAKTRTANAGHGHVELLQVDAQTHPFEPGRYDLVASRFGVMFFADPVAAFGNLKRALRPGGALTFVAWSPMQANPWFALPLEAAVPFVGPPDPAPPRTPGPFAFDDPAYVEEILTAAGYAEVAIETVATTLTGAATAAEEAEMVCQVGPLTRLLRARAPDEATRGRLVAAVTDALRPFQTAAGVRIPATVHCARATSAAPI
jgi:SAM-dependent methyltransferase